MQHMNLPPFGAASGQSNQRVYHLLMIAVLLLCATDPLGAAVIAGY